MDIRPPLPPGSRHSDPYEMSDEEMYELELQQELTALNEELEGIEDAHDNAVDHHEAIADRAIFANLALILLSDYPEIHSINGETVEGMNQQQLTSWLVLLTKTERKNFIEAIKDYAIGKIKAKLRKKYNLADTGDEKQKGSGLYDAYTDPYFGRMTLV